jgi:microcystin-dependent protein
MSIRNRLHPLSLLLAAGLTLATPQAAQAQATPYIGQIMEVGYNFCPLGWADTLGQLLPIAQNTALFSLLGTTYGGNGTTTFALPYQPPRSLQNGSTIRYCIALVGVFPSRN